MGIVKKILTKLLVSTAMSGVMLYADYKINGDYSTVGILKRLKAASKKEDKVQKSDKGYVIPASSYQVE